MTRVCSLQLEDGAASKIAATRSRSVKHFFHYRWRTERCVPIAPTGKCVQDGLGTLFRELEECAAAGSAATRATPRCRRSVEIAAAVDDNTSLRVAAVSSAGKGIKDAFVADGNLLRENRSATLTAAPRSAAGRCCANELVQFPAEQNAVGKGTVIASFENVKSTFIAIVLHKEDRTAAIPTTACAAAEARRSIEITVSAHGNARCRIGPISAAGEGMEDFVGAVLQ